VIGQRLFCAIMELVRASMLRVPSSTGPYSIVPEPDYRRRQMRRCVAALPSHAMNSPRRIHSPFAGLA